MKLSRATIHLPWGGQLSVVGNNRTVAAVSFGEVAIAAEHNPRQIEPILDELREYFAGTRKVFTLNIVHPARLGTSFMRNVWDELTRIPYGTTISYKELAMRVGTPRGARAVGQSVGRNPIAIIVPCHRVVRSDGTLGGFTGGLETKRKLLKLEGAL